MWLSIETLEEPVPATCSKSAPLNLDVTCSMPADGIELAEGACGEKGRLVNNSAKHGAAYILCQCS